MENAEQIIEHARKNGICMILNGTDPSSNKEVLDLSAEYDNVYAALGYLYSVADEITDEDICLLDRQLENDKVVAVGEIGLDYYHTKDNMDKQKELFEKMLGLAQKHSLPVIVHSRKSMQDSFDILKKHDVVGSMHCYQGSAEMAREFIKLGFYIGIGGPITYNNNKKTRKVVNEIDINHLLVETDSPYLSPVPYRGQVNTPCNIPVIAKKIAEIKGEDLLDVSKVTTSNAYDVFDF